MYPAFSTASLFAQILTRADVDGWVVCPSKNAAARPEFLDSEYEPRFQPRTICQKSTVPPSASSTLPSRNGLFPTTV